MRQFTRMLAAVALLLVICTMVGGSGTAQGDPSKYPPPNNNCRNTGSFERWLAGFRKEAAAKRHLARHHRCRARRHDASTPASSPATAGRASSPRASRAFSGKLISQEPAAIRRRAAQEARGAAGQGRGEIRRAGPRDRRLLGAGERLRRRHGQSARAALARHARLRLPPARDVPRRADGRAAHHRPRRPQARGDDRLVGRRARPDAVPALALSQARGRLRRRRPPQPDVEPARRRRLHRRLHAAPRLAARPAVAAGGARHGNSALGPGRPRHPAPALQVGGLGRDASSTASRCRPTPCRPRWCCRWAASARRSWPTRTSRST